MRFRAPPTTGRLLHCCLLESACVSGQMISMRTLPPQTLGYPTRVIKRSEGQGVQGMKCQEASIPGDFYLLSTVPGS